MSLLIGGCAKTGALMPIANSAEKTLEALEQSIPQQCQTDTVKANIEALKSQIKAIPAVCKTEIQPYKEQRDKWRGWTFALIILIILFLKKIYYNKYAAWGGDPH